MNNSKFPDWFTMPVELVAIHTRGLIKYIPWEFLDEEYMKELSESLKSTYPKSDLVPFAWRRDRDDTACFEKGKGIIVIDVSEPEGLERLEEDSMEFWDWYKRYVIADMIERIEEDGE